MSSRHVIPGNGDHLRRGKRGFADAFRLAWFHQELDFLDGLIYNSGETTGRPRGALDSGKLRELITYVAGNEDLQNAFRLAWLALLRVGELAALTVEDVNLAAPVALLTIRNPKADRARHRVKHQLRPCEEARHLLVHLTRNRSHGEKLLPNFTAASAREAIRQCAAHYHWPDEVLWDGPHTLRHGAAEELEVIHLRQYRWLTRGGWSLKSASSLARYRGQKRGRTE